MNFDLKEAVDYYRRQGAPGDQNALRNLLAEIQNAHGGAIPSGLLPRTAEALGVKESFLSAIIRRIPSLRLADVHILEICAGPNCSRRGRLAELAEQYRGRAEVKYVPCMRQCGKGPNLRFDGTLYNAADEQLLARLMDGIDK
ncbi:MAG: formate dehydrogenase [Oscillospiraceae bacterium]|nr:formate dehydrogenase [Oscillospiraceae bacterium]